MSEQKTMSEPKPADTKAATKQTQKPKVRTAELEGYLIAEISEPQGIDHWLIDKKPMTSLLYEKLGVDVVELERQQKQRAGAKGLGRLRVLVELTEEE